MQVNSGAALAGGPAASIQVPVTVNSGGLLVPDASQGAATLIGSTLTMNSGAIFQWAYNTPSAMGTIAMGSNSLYLPASGSPVFQPAFSVPPTLPINVITWSGSPANTPAWTFDSSHVGAGSYASWGDGSGSWDTGANWQYPYVTGGALSYTAGGLQLTSLTYSQTATGLSPATGPAC